MNIDVTEYVLVVRDRDAAKARVSELEAEAAQLREALRWSISQGVELSADWKPGSDVTFGTRGCGCCGDYGVQPPDDLREAFTHAATAEHQRRIR